MALVAPSSLRALETFHSETHWLKEMAGRWAESGVWPKVFMKGPNQRRTGSNRAGRRGLEVWEGPRLDKFTSARPNHQSARWGGCHTSGAPTGLTHPRVADQLSQWGTWVGGCLGQKWRSAVLRLFAKGALSWLHELILTFPEGISQEPQE